MSDEHHHPFEVPRVEVKMPLINPTHSTKLPLRLPSAAAAALPALCCSYEGLGISEPNGGVSDMRNENERTTLFNADKVGHLVSLSTGNRTVHVYRPES
jgi:hypothetical protein